jgi:hypothetical protein
MRRLVVAMVIGLLGLTCVPTAWADTGSENDPSGDAVATIDITRFRVTNGDHRFRMKVEVRNLRHRGELKFYYWGGTTQSPPPRSALVVVRQVDGEAHARFFACDSEVCYPARCRRMRVAWRPAADEVMVSVRQRCFPRPRSHPGAPPPGVGRFFAASEVGEDFDDTDGLRVERG